VLAGSAFEEFAEYDWARFEAMRLDELHLVAQEDLFEARSLSVTTFLLSVIWTLSLRSIHCGNDCGNNSSSPCVAAAGQQRRSDERRRFGS